MNLQRIGGALALGVGILIGSSGASHALVMDFGTNDGTNAAVYGPFTQSGLTMTPVDSGSVYASHWDRLGSVHGATAGDNSAALHRGKNAEEVTFSYLGGAAFDLLSIDIEALMLQGAVSITGTFTASSGAVTSASGIGAIDFTNLTGWTNITSFNFSLPIQTAICDKGVSVDCSGMVFDNISFQPHLLSQLHVDDETSEVSEPGTLALFALGLVGLGFARRQRRA